MDPNLKKLLTLLTNLVEVHRKIMSAITDLQAAEQTVASSIEAAVTLINAFVAGTVNADDPAVETVVAQLNSSAAALNTAVAAAAPPAPPPPPAS